MAEFEFDFTGQTPIEEMGGSDRIPVGRYRLRLDKFEDGHSSGGKRMIKTNLSVAEGPLTGSRLMDNFVLEGAKNDVGVKRFMGFILSLGVKLPAKTVKFNTDALLGKITESDVRDETIPASGEYPERVVSKPVAYYIPQEIKEWMNGQPAPAAPPPIATPVAVAPAPAPAPAAVAVAEAPVAAPAPPPPAAEPVVAAAVEVAPAPVAAAVDVSPTASLDDLFGS